MIAQGDICWGDLDDPLGAAPGYRRPLLIVQSDRFNQSLIRTVVCVPLTGTLRLANAPGNVLLRARDTGLDRDSVANVSGLLTADRAVLGERVGRVSRAQLDKVFSGIDLLLGR